MNSPISASLRRNPISSTRRRVPGTDAGAAVEGDRFNHFKNVPVELEFVQKPTPPLWYGLSAAAVVLWAAENGINIVCNTAAKAVRPITDRYREIWVGTPRASRIL